MIKKRIISAAAALVTAFSASAHAYPNISETAFTAEAAAFQNISMLSVNSGAMLVRGAVRYIDNQNVSLTPKLVEARTYLPVDAVRVLFNTYIDQADDRPYADMRYDELRLVLNGTNAEVNGTEEKNSYLIYIDGEAYMPLRAVGELLGERVYYDNGYITIGSESGVSEFISGNYYDTGKTRLDSFAPQERGKTIYVAPNGRRFGSGTMGDPKNLSSASYAESGDTIILMDGTYRETIEPQNNGTPGRPITYKVQNGAKAVISALEEVSGFSYYDESNNIVSKEFTSIGAGRDLLFYNGRSLVEARFPNVNSEDYTASDASEWFPTKGALTLENADKPYTVTSSLLNGDAENRWKGARFVSLHGGAWNTSTGVVASSKSGSFELDPDSVTKKWWFAQSSSNPVNFGYLTGTKEAIDLPGEWTVEDDTVYMKLLNGETADSLSVEMKSRQLCIDLSGKSYINIEGIETIGGGINMNGTNMCVLTDCNFKNISHYTLCNDSREGYIDSQITETTNPTDKNGAPQRGEMGIYMSGKNDVVQGCTIDTSAGAAFYMTGLYSMLDNNKAINCGYMGSTVGGIYIGSCAWESSGTPRGGYIIINNEIRNTARSALTVQPTEHGWTGSGKQAAYVPCEIAYNKFSNGGIAACDTGVVYLWGATMGNSQRMTRIHHNVVYADCNTPERLLGMIYHDNFINMIQTYKNVMFTTSQTSSYCYMYTQNTANGTRFQTSYAVVNDYDGTVYDGSKVFNNPIGSNKGFSDINSLDDIPESDYPDDMYFHSGLR